MDDFEVVNGQLIRIPSKSAIDHSQASTSRQQIVENVKHCHNYAKAQANCKDWINKHSQYHK